MERWYAVHTNARGEEKALFNLMRQGYVAHLPRYRKIRRHARRVERVLAPLFPRYLFVRLDMEVQRWRPILSTLGVRDLVRVGNSPAPVPNRVVDEIVARQDEHGAVRLDPPHFVKGQSLRITDGAFSDSIGLFTDMSSDRRVFMLLEMLGRQVRVQVSLDNVVPA